jgi:hypothetical protein
MNRNKKMIGGVAAGGVALAVLVAAGIYLLSESVHTVVRDQVTPSEPEDLLADDRLKDKNPEFNPDLIYPPRVGGDENPWQLNLSAAVIKLDVPDIVEGREEVLQRLYPSFTDAATELEENGYRILPGINMVAGKTKQFDDGLFAALDAWAVSNRQRGIRDLELLLRQIMTELHPTEPAYAWVWAALEVGRFVSPEESPRRPAAALEFINRFLADSAQSRPVGFYNWNDELQRIFRFLRFLQQPFNARDGIPDSIARVLKRDGHWLEKYRQVLNFYARLTNPPRGVSFALLADPANEGKSVRQIAAEMELADPRAAFLPAASSREAALFEALYPMGVPEHADLMRELIVAIRDGQVDLKPTEESGWYDHQQYALETFLLPERGPENQKLLLTRKYKQRLIEAFKSSMTRVRETHVRSLGPADGALSAPPPSAGVAPPLRVEPNPTYFLRLGRSYGFLQRFLMESVDDLNDLYGYRRSGFRDRPLGDDLELQRLLMYGLYLISCDDIGLEPEDLAREIQSPDYCRALALDWLENWREDPDMQVDTRIAVPIMINPDGRSRLWCNVGIRPVKLSAEFVRPPSWRPDPGSEDPAEWDEVPRGSLEKAEWIILCDQFIEVERPTDTPLTRKELRDVCDAHETPEQIAKALAR